MSERYKWDISVEKITWCNLLFEGSFQLKIKQKSFSNTKSIYCKIIKISLAFDTLGNKKTEKWNFLKK